MGINEFEIITASKEVIWQYIDQLLVIDESHFQDESWDENAFMSELPSKFEKSLLVINAGKVAGYSIVSQKNSNIHIHKFAISKEFLSLGLGEKLINRLSKMTDGIPITLKVHVSNIGAVIFYLKKGFLFQEKTENYYHMMKDGK